MSEDIVVTRIYTEAPSITVEITKHFGDLDNVLRGDLSTADDQELQDFLLDVMYRVYKITYNALDYANKKLDIINLPALQYILDVRKKKVTYSEQALAGLDKRALLVYTIIAKLDMLDSSISQVLLLALRQSAR